MSIFSGNVRIIGDIHANFDLYSNLIKCDHPTIQVGDFGFGFGNPPPMADKDFFIRGNHDNPALAKAHPNYIGDIVVEGPIFFMGGAYSIDRDTRTIGRDWWEDEELSYSALMNAIDIYKQVKPKIVITHDCPKSASTAIFNRHRIIQNRTSSALDTMFEIHKPELWLFGHWHINVQQVILGTKFICIANDDALDVNFSWAF